MTPEVETIGRYALHGPISSGGMASVHYGRLLGPIGFARTVAIKRLHAAIAADPENRAMFLDEARLSARIHHPNVVPTIDVIEHGSELLLVMDYVAGPSLSGLVRLLGKQNEKMPHAHAVAIILGALHGLHAAHEARGSNGEPLSIVHRDVSPQNIIVGDDGVPRLIDFGIAKAVERVYLTRGNEIRGKILYMAPEQLSRGEVDRRADIYACSVVLWELLTGRRLVDLGQCEDPLLAIEIVRNNTPVAPSSFGPDIPRELDAVVMRGLAHRPAERFATALEMAIALETVFAPASQREVAAWVKRVASDLLTQRAAALRAIEAASTASLPVAPPPVPSSRAPATPGRLAFTLVHDAPRAPNRKSFDARPLAFAGVVVAIVLAWVAGTHRGAASVPPVIVTAPPVAAASFPAPAPIPTPSASADLEIPAPAPKPSATHPRPVVRPKNKCDPPYTVDSKGVRVPKPECR